jgi:D-glycero-D-manno-heptose 1,7-bisphosphate phosphatase
MKRPAVFIDRDGTINEQMGYINHISRFVLLPGAADGIKLLNRYHFLVVVVSNQSGVAREYFPIRLVDEVHAYMKELVEREGGHIDGIFFCPHHTNGNMREYSIECDCRKPRTGLIERACQDFDIDMESSYVIGDRCTDIELAHRANLNGILVTTGYGLGEIDHVLPKTPYKPIHIAKDLLYAVRWIIEAEGKKSEG